jgi:ankyrin repeat protein
VGAKHDQTSFLSSFLSHASVEEINGFDNFGHTALDYALSSKRYNSIESLVRHGASVYSPTAHVALNVHDCIRAGQYAVVQLLCTHTPSLLDSVEIKAVMGTPKTLRLLNVAIQGLSNLDSNCSVPEIVQFLLAARASTNTVDGDGNLPLHYVTRYRT